VLKYAIKPSRVVGHSDVNAKSGILELRNDPSEMFDWKMLEKKQLTLERRTYVGADPMLQALRTSTPNIASEPSKVIRVKELLHDIGYAVAAAAVRPGTPRGQITQRLAKPKFTGVVDRGLDQAVMAFQLRHFSGERRRYRFRDDVPTDPKVKAPLLGTLDQATIAAIVDVWNDKQVRG